ncbi:hypothetical protein [Ignavibacterium sp.]|uniref:hypothetical protein n=1 Tax=Ignavibacterium sp. TaxID=2651167 RepID=UPI002207FD0B|nr:hypothetical protein [Ignavibacterium sp.]BDQ02751.1 MAG: hypothetical protein KatS3mg037_1326 [Ignavibacterium sp.]
MISAEKIKIADFTSSGEVSKNSARDLRRKKALKISMIKTYLSVLYFFVLVGLTLYLFVK